MIIKMIISIIAYLILAPLAGGILAGLDRKVSARMQGRVGPPVLQPFYDVFKLFEKEAVTVTRVQDFYVMIIAAYSSNSPYAQVGAERELLQMMAYEPMVLMTAIAFYMYCGSFTVRDILAGSSMPILPLIGIFIGFVFILTIKFRKSPFDLSMSHHAHQELVKGITTEFSGRTLGLIEISHWYENIMLLGFVFLFFANGTVWGAVIGVLVCLIAYFFEVLIDNSFARMKWQFAFKSAWIVALVFGVVNIFILYLIV